MKTKSISTKDIQRNWHHVDADDQILGRVATQIAQLLIGKNKPDFTPNLDCGDYVVVTNTNKIRVTGGKQHKKIYYRHSGYPGGFKQETYKDLFDRDPNQVLKNAVNGMLPKNKLRKPRLNRLKIFTDTKHPYQDQLKGNQDA